MLSEPGRWVCNPSLPGENCDAKSCILSLFGADYKRQVFPYNTLYIRLMEKGFDIQISTFL
jgi:hypothetical protein